MDSVRRDHLSCYGHKRPTSPFLEELCSEGCLFNNAYSTACWTLPSHASILTGLHPVSHGAHWENLYLDEGLRLLPDILGEHGYQSAYFSENPLISPKRGFGRGFDLVNMKARRNDVREERLLQEIVRHLASRPQCPFFFFINLNTAHKPYDAAGAFDGRFLSDAAYQNMDRHPRLAQWLTGEQHYTLSGLHHLEECYDEEIRRLDSTIRKLVNTLKASGHWDSTALIVAADHGENFGDHGLVSHQLCLYQSLVRIPLIIRCPGRVPTNTRKNAPVQLTDLFATVLDLAAIDPRICPHQGTSLVSGRLDPARPVILENYEHKGFRDADPSDPWTHPKLLPYRRRLRAVISGRMKLIAGSDGTRELYDLVTDPTEGTDLAPTGRHQDALERLPRILDERIAAFATMRDGIPRREEESEPASTEDLEALGYL